MNTGSDPGQDLLMARSHIRTALAEWSSANLSGAERACELLQMAAEDLAKARKAARNKSLPGGIRMDRQLCELRDDLKLMARLVDASAAFCHGMALSMGLQPDGALESPVSVLPDGVQA